MNDDNCGNVYDIFFQCFQSQIVTVLQKLNDSGRSLALNVTVKDVIAILRCVEEDEKEFKKRGQLECCNGWHADVCKRVRRQLVECALTESDSDRKI